MENLSSEDDFLGKGFEMMNSGKFEDALNVFNFGIASHPNSSLLYNSRALALKHLLRYEEALIAVEAAIGLDPAEINLRYNKGVALIDLGRFTEAAEIYEEAISMDPDCGQSYFEYGTALLTMGEMEKVLVALEKAASLSPTDPECYSLLGWVNFCLGQFPAAQANYNRYIFIGKIASKNYSNLLKFFRDFSDAPFVVNRLMGDYLIYPFVITLRSYLEKISKQCKPVLDCLDWLEMEGVSNERPVALQLFKARCNYFMGDSAAAFHLFNSLADAGHQLDLGDQYYRILAACGCAEQEPIITQLIENAVAEAQQDSFADVTQQYYAGLILYDFWSQEGGIAEAEALFDESIELLASRYMKLKFINERQKSAWRQQIINIESRLPACQRLSAGPSPRAVSTDFSGCLTAMQQYCYHSELQGAVADVYSYDSAVPFIPFYEYWQFELSDDFIDHATGKVTVGQSTQLEAYRISKIAEAAYARIERLLEVIKEKLNAEKIEDNIRRGLGSLYEKLYVLKKIADDQTEPLSPEAMEELLASHIWESVFSPAFTDLKIKGLSYWEVHQQFILFFLGRGQIGKRGAISLIMYAGYKAGNASLMRKVAKPALFDGAADALKATPDLQLLNDLKEEILGSKEMAEIGSLFAGALVTMTAATIGTLGGPLLLGFMAKSLIAILENQISPSEQPGYWPEYIQFKADLDRRVALAQRQGEFDPVVERILGCS